MASLRNNIVVVIVAVAVVAATLLLTLSEAQTCPDELVYPYLSLCSNPALYDVEEYELEAAPLVGVSGSLAPEYDESNSTYYVRLADVGAKYKLMHKSLEYRDVVAQSDDVVLVNVESGRYVGWRAEGEDEMWLVETAVEDDVAVLQFKAAPDVPTVCPRIDPSVIQLSCEAYYIVSYGTSYGLSPQEEEGAIYFKQGSDTGLGFLLVRSTTSSSLPSKSVLA